jgi:hypothetical protein
MVAQFSIPDLQSIIHAVLPRRPVRTGWLLWSVWSVSFIWLNQIDQIDQMNQMNLPQSCPSSMSHARVIAAQSFATIHKTSMMRRTRSRTVPAMMQAT